MVLGLVWPGLAYAVAVGGLLEWLSERGASVPQLVSHHPVGVPDFCAARGSPSAQGENLKLLGRLRPGLESHVRSRLLHSTDKTLSQGSVQFKGVKDKNLSAGGVAASHDRGV